MSSETVRSAKETVKSNPSAKQKEESVIVLLQAAGSASTKPALKEVMIQRTILLEILINKESNIEGFKNRRDSKVGLVDLDNFSSGRKGRVKRAGGRS